MDTVEVLIRASSEIKEYPDINFPKLIEKRKTIKMYAIEGNISAGKSTFLERLKHKYENKYEFVSEPIDEWQNTKVDITLEEGKNCNLNMLDIFYRDTKNRAALFQIYALFTRMRKLINSIMKSNKDIFIIERSPLSDFNCFANTNKNEGNIDGFGYVIYKLLYEFVIGFIKILVPDFIIYLRLEPQFCYQRVLGRNRPEEVPITLDYLTKLHNDHEIWLNNEQIPVIYVNSLLNYKDCDNILEAIHSDIINVKNINKDYKEDLLCITLNKDN